MARSSSMALFLNVRELTLLVGYLSTALLLAFGQDVPEPDACTPESAFECYDQYRLDFKGAQALAVEGKYQDAIYGKCSVVKDKLPCHKQISLCPESKAADFRRQEQGYQALSDIICNDTQALNDSYAAGLCQDVDKLIECLVERNFRLHEDDPPRNENMRLCRRLQGSLGCYEETFNSSCPVPLESAKPAFAKTQEAFILLAGCDEPNGSAHLSATLQGLPVALIALAVARWTAS
ncbi:hypothetical protein V5799_027648 [Amblyomma americanum]|uniref:Secreted protein n=1 Tax=Amblyomma americanum TaxID=6943 RepID=A0AAQ4DF43_AMBAM